MILKFIINKHLEWRILLKFNSICKSLAFKILIFFILIYFLFTVNQGFTIDSSDENSKINKRRETKLAQTSQIQNQDQRIEELERKLNLITEELKQLKSQSDLPDSRLESIEEKLSVLAEEIDNIKQATVVTEPAYEQVFGTAPAASKVYFRELLSLFRITRASLFPDLENLSQELASLQYIPVQYEAPDQPKD